MTPTVEPVEAVIISGPRRGEIVRLSDPASADVSEEEIETLGHALDDLLAAIDRVSSEVRATTEALRCRAEAA